MPHLMPRSLTRSRGRVRSRMPVPPITTVPLPTDLRNVSSYGPTGDLTTSLGRRQIELGPKPDFDADFRKYRLAYKPRAAAQASALRSPAVRTSQQTRTPAPERPPVVAPAEPDYGPTPASFGRWMMNPTGNWGTFVDPANIPAGLQSAIMGGFYGDIGNWDTTNPMIMGPQQFSTGKYTHSGK